MAPKKKVRQIREVVHWPRCGTMVGYWFPFRDAETTSRQVGSMYDQENGGHPADLGSCVFCEPSGPRVQPGGLGPIYSARILASANGHVCGLADKGLVYLTSLLASASGCARCLAG